MTSSRGKHFSSEPSVEFGEDTDQFEAPAGTEGSSRRRSQEPEVETLTRPAPDDAPHRPEHHDPDGDPGTPKKKRHVLRWVLIVLLVLVVLLAGAAVAAFSYLRGAVQAGEESIVQTIEEAKVKTPTITNVLRYKGVSYEPNSSMVSIAFIGFDGNDEHGAGQADTVIVISLNTEDGSISAISIPRDSMVEVNEFLAGDFLGQETMQLCLAYSYGDGADGSSRNVADLASRILYDVPVAYYFTLDLSGIGPLNDSIGGVTLTPLETIPNTSIEAGVPVTLWGMEAQRYVQWRSSDDVTSSLARQDRQVQYLQAFATQIIEAAKSNPAVLLDLYNTAVQYSFTNLSFEEFSYLVSAMTSTGFSSLSTRTLPGEMVQGSIYAEFYLDKEGVRQAVLDTFYHVVDDDVNVDQVIEEEGAAAATEGDPAAEGNPVTENDPTIAPDPDPAADGVPVEGRDVVEEIPA